MLYPEIVIAGCGNPLFADDGFGPAVVEELRKFPLPGHIKVVDAGLGGPYFVFSLLDPKITRKLIVVDIVDFGAGSGALALFRMNDLMTGGLRDADQGGLAASLRRIGGSIDVVIIGCQPGSVRGMEIGLSREARTAVPKTVRAILELVGADFRAVCECHRFACRHPDGETAV